MPAVREAGPVTPSVVPVFWSSWPRWDKRGSPTLPVPLGFFGGELSTFGVGVGCRGWHSGLISPYSLESKAPEAGCVHVHVQCGLSALALHVGTLDSGISKRGDLAGTPHTARGLVQMNSWLLILMRGTPGGKKSSIFPAPKSEHFVKKKIPPERQFSGKHY